VQADKEYLEILHAAARQSEDLVNRSLQKIISEGSMLNAASVSTLVKWLETNGIPHIIDTPVAQANLRQYDNLLNFEAVAL
jgi:hypothetical protein